MADPRRARRKKLESDEKKEVQDENSESEVIRSQGDT